MSKYNELQNLVSSYGDATRLLIAESRRFGRMVLDGLPEFFDCSEDKIRGVPPEGDVEPRKNYNDAIFSFFNQKLTLLEPVTMGLYVEIANLKDHGATWVLLNIEFWVSGSNMVITVAGNDQRAVTVPRSEAPDLTLLYDVIFDEVRAEFSVDLDASGGRRRIGFTGPAS